MPITIEIPSSMRRFVDNERRVKLDRAATVREALDLLVAKNPLLRPYLFTDSGELFSYIGLFVNRKDIRSLQMEKTPLYAGDNIALLPAVAGG
ncbi:MoaD/ThiS family protein [Microbulbifer sp. 2205BS26-8]|uniref:MoaD/ThiS family protein n=1 Tax=Microbulbifer sp. 2205BS26-8 TaxID=3064386 RepID=UPI00273F47CC|nr:MoaD/ThiS family protein [Microbulbifer sp. 2205BS26-8]MDP5210792.1 MoaD/ThiS family protein [Microbulbifer sp. 2205BS26-8]